MKDRDMYVGKRKSDAPRKIVIGLAVVLAIVGATGLILFFALRGKNGESTQSANDVPPTQAVTENTETPLLTPTVQPTVTPATTTPPTSLDPKYQPMKEGDESLNVMRMQIELIELGYLSIDRPTEYFGTTTKAAVMEFQKQNGLQQTGIADTETLMLLYSGDAKPFQRGN